MSENKRAALQRWLAISLLLILPAAFLAPSLFGPKVLLPFEAGQFPPKIYTLDEAQRAEVLESERNMLVTEIDVLVVPELKLAHEELEAGRFPGWNPYARFGAPLYANGLAAMAQPKNLALLVDDDPVGQLALSGWIALALASVLTFALLTKLGCGPWAASFGALCFGLGGTMTANLHFYMRADTLAILPGLALGVLGVCAADNWPRRLRSTAGLSLCAAWALLSGFPPYAVAGLVFAGLLALGLLIGHLIRERRITGVWPRAAMLAAGVGLGALLSGVQLLPMFEYFPESNRKLTIDPVSYRAEGFAPQGFATMLLPEALGTPDDALGTPDRSPLALLWNDRVDADGHLLLPTNNHVEYTLFPGTLGWVAILLALLLSRGRRFWLALSTTGLTAVSILLATAPAWLSLHTVPLVSSVPPMRFLCIAALGTAVLVGLGVQTLFESRSARGLRIAAAATLLGALAMAIGAFSEPLSEVDPLVESLYQRDWPSKHYEAPNQLTRDAVRTVLSNGYGAAAAPQAVAIYAERLASAMWRSSGLLALGGLIVLAFSFLRQPAARLGLIALGLSVTGAELWWLGEQSVAHRPTPQPVNETPVHDFLRERNAERAERGGVMLARVSPPTQMRIPSDLPTGALFPERLRDLHSYAFSDSRSHLLLEGLIGEGRMLRKFWPMALPDDPAVLGHPLWDLLGVDTIVTATEAQHAGPLATEVFEFPGGRFFVYDRPTALPRAFVVHERTRVADDDQVRAAMLDPGFEPARHVLLTPDQNELLKAAPLGETPDSPRSVRIVEDVPNRVRMEVGDGPAGLLVVRDTEMSGWTATVDGKEVDIARGDLFARVVAVPEGGCTVEFSYSPPGLTFGVILSVLGGVALAALLWFWFRLGRRAAAATSPQTEPGDLTPQA